MGSSSPDADTEYGKFLEKVERTFYVDNLSPQVTSSVMKAAFNQFGMVVSVQFIPNYLHPSSMPQAALVEMGTVENARTIIRDTLAYPFMISGMPRPVRALPAKPEMFDERPRKPGRKIFCQWLDPKDPNFEVATKIKKLVSKQAAEASFLLEHQLAQEEKLHNQQAEALKSHYKKFELIDKTFEDNTSKKLGRHYGLNVTDPGVSYVPDA